VAPTRATRTTQLDFHHGEVLLKLSDTYPTLSRSILEMIQNALDALASHVYVKIDLKNREAIVMDDGEGISEEKFNEALKSVGRSVKSRRNKLGRFGLGLISPLRKVREYKITSFPVGANAPIEWTFNPRKIVDQANGVTIPMRTLARFVPVPNKWEVQTSWRTIVQLVGITSDKVISMVDLDNFEDDLLANFGQAMRMHGTTCYIELIDEQGRHQQRVIRPKDYSGQPFSPVSYQGEDAGTVTFELFRARSRSGKRNGVVSVRQEGDLFLVPWKNFVIQARGLNWADTSPAFAALGSGYFEGIITAQNIKLALTRSKFEISDALMDLYTLIDDWYGEHGLAYLTDEREKARSERLQQLGLKSLERWNDLLDDPAYASLRRALLETFIFGRLGAGHMMPEAQLGDFEREPSTRIGQGGAGKERHPRDDAPQPGTPQGPDRPGDLPLTSRGPKGHPRQLVKHDSLGLQLAYEPLDSARLWELDANMGVLYFNTSHRLWEQCEKKDSHVLHLQDWVILQVLHLLTMPPERFEDYRELVDQQAKSYVDLFISSSPPRRL
jgi:hypothetical protein